MLWKFWGDWKKLLSFWSHFTLSHWNRKDFSRVQIFCDDEIFHNFYFFMLREFLLDWKNSYHFGHTLRYRTETVRNFARAQNFCDCKLSITSIFSCCDHLGKEKKKWPRFLWRKTLIHTINFFLNWIHQICDHLGKKIKMAQTTYYLIYCCRRLLLAHSA